VAAGCHLDGTFYTIRRTVRWDRRVWALGPRARSAAVVAENETVSITNISGERQLFEEPREDLLVVI
jgi:hypothetical protein